MTRVHFETARLVVRDWVADDWRLACALAAEPAVTRYQTWLRLPDEDACKKWIADAIVHNELEPRVAYNTAVVLKGAERAIGWLGWGTGEGQDAGHGSFGYALLPEVWSRGYMTEAVGGMARYAFEVLGLKSLTATCATSNRASALVLERTGMKLLHRWSERDEALDIEEEHSYYRLKQADWLKRSRSAHRSPGVRAEGAAMLPSVEPVSDDSPNDA